MLSIKFKIQLPFLCLELNIFYRIAKMVRFYATGVLLDIKSNPLLCYEKFLIEKMGKCLVSSGRGGFL